MKTPPNIDAIVEKHGWMINDAPVQHIDHICEVIESAIQEALALQSKEPEYNCPPVCPKCQRCHRGACVSNEDKQAADSFFAEQFKPSGNN
jgi:hypothetical protein